MPFNPGNVRSIYCTYRCNCAVRVHFINPLFFSVKETVTWHLYSILERLCCSAAAAMSHWALGSCSNLLVDSLRSGWKKFLQKVQRFLFSSRTINRNGRTWCWENSSPYCFSQNKFRLRKRSSSMLEKVMLPPFPVSSSATQIQIA